MLYDANVVPCIPEVDAYLSCFKGHLCLLCHAMQVIIPCTSQLISMLRASRTSEKEDYVSILYACMLCGVDPSYGFYITAFPQGS